MKRKRLDWFIIKSFLLLFAAAFFICLFVLLMNILWRYVEDLVGKGFTFSVIARFFFLFGMRLVPEALPLAVLMASLITFGNFGERLELLAMKTAGISLLRIMRPLTIFCICLAGISFYFQNVTVPKTTQKLYSLIYSINEKNPELEIPEGTFYDQISGYNMYVKHKDLNTGNLYDVTIYDHSNGYENLSVIVADSAYLETTADEEHLMLHLFSGKWFSQDTDIDDKGQPYKRESFAEKHILLDFDSGFRQADNDIMSSQAESKNMVQIKETIDSLSLQQDSVGLGNLAEFKGQAMNIYRMSAQDSVRMSEENLSTINADSLFHVASRDGQIEIRKSMRQVVSTQSNELTIKGSNMFSGDRVIRKHWISWMKKIVNSLSILIFFFIGAPLGAIIRKGGLGVPVIVSVLTYILFYITSVSGEKMFREGVWSIIGCWLSTLVLTPLSVFFTVKANKDSTVFQPEVIVEFLKYWFGGRTARNITRKDVVIDEPDRNMCLGLTGNIRTASARIMDSELSNRMPRYLSLFFRPLDTSDMDNLYADADKLALELGNSRDRVELDLVNGMPIIPVHGVKGPFRHRWLNVLSGILVPLGLLFSLREWLFRSKIMKQVAQAARVAGELEEYMKKNNQL